MPIGSGGDGTLSYAATPLPAGLSFDDLTRTIAGTPTGNGPTTVRYTVTDSDGDSAYVDFTITVVADLTPTLNAISGYTARVNSPFSEVLPAATGGDTPLGYTVDDLPTGLSFTEATRTIAGTPTTVEAPTVTYTVRDADGDEAIKTFTISVVADLTPTFDPIAGYTARVGSPFREVLPAATGGDGTLSYTATPLPDGLTFDNVSRTVSGTPTTVEAPTVTYTVRDADGDEAIKTFTISVVADQTPTLESIDDTSAKLTKVFTRQLPAGSGGDGDLVYAVTGLPDGLTFVDSSRTIAGTPTVANDFEVAYTATDEDNDEARQTFHIVVYEFPSLSEVADVMATKDEVFTLVLTAVSGGKEPFTYTVTGLPTGLSFDKPSLTIIGTPTQIQVADVTFAVEDDDGDTASQDFQISVSEGDTEPTFPYTIPDLRLRVDSPYTVLLPGATGGNAPYTYTISGLPETLSFNPDTRWISGTPTASGLHQVTFTATDRDLDPVSQTFELNIAADNMPTEPSVDDLHLKVARAFNLELPEGANGDSPYTYTVSALPSGLDFDDQTRFISGTPDTPGMTNVTYTVTDDDGDPISTDFKVTVYPMPSLIDVSDISIMQGDLYTLVLPEATGGRPQFDYSVTALPSGLPTGLQFITETRVITGTPTQMDVATVTYTVTDTDNDQDSVTFKITVNEPDQGVQGGNNQVGNQGGGNQGGGNTQNPPALTLYVSVGFSAKVGEQFHQQLPAANGGTPRYEYSVNALPAGLTFDRGTHTISGTPTDDGETPITYTVTDANYRTASDDFTITVSPAVLSLGDTTGFSATVGEQFTQQLPAANGGRSPYTYTVTQLPAGLTFNRGTHTISGTPTEEGTTVVTYRVTDNGNNQADDDFTITVNPVVLRLSDTTGFTAIVGEQFTQQLPAATGGTSPYTYTVTQLPAGLTFNRGTHTITGTPTLAGPTVVTYTVTDGNLDSVSDAFTITVSEAQADQLSGTGNGGKGGGSSGGGGNNGGGGSGTKSNSGNSGNSGNQQRYVPPQPSQRQSSSTPIPVAVTIPVLLNVRSGPGLDYEVITTVPEGTRASIYGRDPLDDWFQVQIEGVDGMVWIYQDLTTVEGSLDGVRFLEQWEIDLIARPGDGPLAITTPDILNVRSGPGLDYDILTTVPKGTQATIIGIGPNSEWYKVNLGVLSEPAWIYAGLTTVTGSLASVRQYTQAEVDGIETGADNPLAIIVPTILNVRSGPGTEYDIVTTVAQGTQAEIIGIGPQDEWFLVELDGLDEPAWIYQDLTTVVGSLAGVRRVASWQVGQPSSDTEVERPIAVTYPSLVNVREGPGESYSVLKAIGQGTRAVIMGIGPDENWYLVDIDGLDQLGWIREDLTVLVGSLDNVKRITAEEIAMLPVAIANTALLNVRSGPDTGYVLVTTISEETWVEVIGVNAQSDWFKVKYDDVGGQGWIYRELTYLTGPLSSVTQSASAGIPTSTQPASTQPAAPTPQPASTPQVAVGSITVDLSLPSNGTIDLEVSWTDAGACSELYRIYYRSNTDSATYFSLETAVLASTANTKSLSFQTLPSSSLISAWCGTHGAGRQVAEVQIDSHVEGTYSSAPSQPATDAVAAGPAAASRN